MAGLSTIRSGQALSQPPVALCIDGRAASSGHGMGNERGAEAVALMKPKPRRRRRGYTVRMAIKGWAPPKNAWPDRVLPKLHATAKIVVERFRRDRRE